MSANDKQVGGEHYRSAKQHWDWVEENRMGYLEGCASKYATRWQEKNGRQDLEKAEHFVDKTIEKFLDGTKYPGPFAGWDADALPAPLEEFATANCLGEKETEVCRLLSTWKDLGDLRDAREVIQSLLVDCDQYALLTEEGGEGFA